MGTTTLGRRTACQQAQRLVVVALRQSASEHDDRVSPRREEVGTTTESRRIQGNKAHTLEHSLSLADLDATDARVLAAAMVPTEMRCVNRTESNDGLLAASSGEDDGLSQTGQ